jgi:hypothetical protein
VGMPSFRTFPEPPGFGIARSRTAADERPCGAEAVHAGSVRTAVARDPLERHDQRRRVVHEVEQVVEPAAGTGHRPTVALGLHLRYPPAWPHGHACQGTGVHRCVFRSCNILISSTLLPPFPMRRALPGSEYYGGSALPLTDRPTTDPARPAALEERQRGSPRAVPVFTVIRSSE